jgi:hypothetical protein
MNTARRRTSALSGRQEHLPGRQAHVDFLLDHGLAGMGTLGREETFTGVLVASLLNSATRADVLRGLQIRTDLDGVPGSLRLTGVYAAVEPIDLVAVFEGTSGRHACAIEVKWRNSKSNHPGSERYPDDCDWWDAAPSQLDRAHELAMRHVLNGEHRGPCSCGYPQVCRMHGCIRGCDSDFNDGQIPKWDLLPLLYPSPGRRSKDFCSLVEHLGIQDARRWSFRFLDYRDRPTDEAFHMGVCNEAWMPVKMSDFAGTLRRQYQDSTPRSAVRFGLEPLLRVIYSD